MTLTLGFSPCPNDTYIFDALVNGYIDNGGLNVKVVMEDVQTLNELAIAGKIDVTKISYGTLPLVLNDYVLLNSGGALGMGVGPLLISKIPLPLPAVKQSVVAIPGKHTTAHVLFSLAFPEATNKVFLRYNEIEEFVLSNSGSLDDIKSVKTGVIIHENRFTYTEKGLINLCDLGSYWENETGLPIPLGGIVAKRALKREVLLQLQELIQVSIAWSDANNRTPGEFIRKHSQEMSEDVMMKHINLYVNNYSSDLGEQGRAAVRKFVQVHTAINKIPVNLDNIFLH